MPLFAVTYHTDSGDHGFVGIYGERPTEAHLATIAREQFPEEIIEEDGREFRLIFFETYEAPNGAALLPAPSTPIPSI